MPATAGLLKEHRRPQRGERVEYQVSRLGYPHGQAWPTDKEVRAFLKAELRPSGRGYGTYYVIRVTQKEMLHTAVLFPGTPFETAQLERREETLFALAQYPPFSSHHSNSRGR